MQLQQLEQLLGPGVFFVPCHWGTKKPLVTYVERPFEGTQSPVYRELLEQQGVNIAVYLGKASGGLCAIDFDSDTDLEEFLELNPKLEATTRSCGSRGAILWVRIDGWYPESCNPDHKHFEWRADGRLATIHGRHPKGMNYQILVNAPPVKIGFDEILWPADWELPWIEGEQELAWRQLEKEYGVAVYIKKDVATGISERFWAALFAKENHVLFDPDDGGFYLYDDAEGLWRPVSQDNIRERLSARLITASHDLGLPSLQMLITQHRLQQVVNALKGIAEKQNAFRPTADHVYLANGVIRFTKDHQVLFTGFAPEDYSRNKSPFHYDGKAECPRFLNELIYPAVSADDADLLQRWAGLALSGYNLPQRMLILDGTPNGGKGTLARILQALVGPHNTCQLRTDCLSERFETFRFRNKTLLIGPDVRGDFLMQRGASALKMLVGGDPLTAEGKGLNTDYPLYGTFNVLITCNSRLRVRLEDDSGAWRRRLLIVRYEKPAPKTRLLNFHETLLREEGSGILRWALAGLAKLQEEFRQVGDFILSDSQKHRIDALLQESESVRVFVRTCLESSTYDDVTSAELTQAYAEFCSEQGWNPLPVTTVEKQLPDLMLETFRVNKCHRIEREGSRSARGWKGVRLKDAATLKLV